VESDDAPSNSFLRKQHNHEVEAKVLLSSTHKGSNFSENTLAAKNLSNSPWEFGYAIGFSRPLTLNASAKRCSWCPQNFIAGAEMYGGLGDRQALAFTRLHTTWRRFLLGICRLIGPCEYPRVSD
jgi:hypothetical protein